MRNLLLFIILGLSIYSCSTTRSTNGVLYGTTDPEPYDTTDVAVNAEQDTVVIANPELEYEIIIIEPGFGTFLNSIARPEGYYSQSYLENKNQFLVTDYNQRVKQPLRYNPEIYAQEINYDPQIDYGYEVNYKLYNYFVYLTRRFNQSFSVPARL
ncbi:DUF6146 family protein [Salinimicrobium sp. GXAS 041]|uniref:DUF6146 family protein n=1 Tax=Salinimicrobium sp. GXAS 041 TaxID=3400806 RepID=UPI003C7918F3